MTGDAGNSVVIERPLHMRVLRQRPGEQRRRIVTSFAMASVFKSLLRLNVLNVFLVERFAKGVTVRGLPPLRVRVCVTNATTPGRDEHIAGNESAGRSRRVAGRKRIRTELEIVGF